MWECSWSLFLDQSHGFLFFYKQGGAASEGRTPRGSCVNLDWEASGLIGPIFAQQLRCLGSLCLYPQIHRESEILKDRDKGVSFFYSQI